MEDAKNSQTNPEQPTNNNPTAASDNANDLPPAADNVDSANPENNPSEKFEKNAENVNPALLEQALKSLQEQNLRLQADIDNMRRQSRLELQKTQKFAIEGFAKALLSVVDSLESSLQAIKDNQPELASFQEGNRLTLELFYKTFKDFSIEAIDPLNEKFDPQWHQAIAQDHSAEAAPQTVIQVLQKGFRLHDRLLRPALVKVRV